MSASVAPHAGAWIETWILFCQGLMNKSHPTRVRGLKLDKTDIFVVVTNVAPHAGAWIETAQRVYNKGGGKVAPHAGATVPCLYVKQGSLFLAKKGEKKREKDLKKGVSDISRQ